MRRFLRQGKITLIACASFLIILFTSPRQLLEKSWSSSVLKISLNVEQQDVLVLLHIPRTGMTSLINLMMKDSVGTMPCRCPEKMTKCKCLTTHNQPWLFHSYNTTGFTCGQFADFTTLTTCPIDHWFTRCGGDNRPSRRYHLLTLLRKPAARYYSEWLQSKNEEEHFFRNEPRLYRNISLELQKKQFPCYLGIKTSTLSLLDFISCSENPANNRQTRMLANLTTVYSMVMKGHSYEMALLYSAQNTLLKLPFFGIIDRPEDTLKLLDHEIGLRFKRTLNQHPTKASREYLSLEQNVYNKLLEANSLDIQLFQFAENYFNQRMNALKDSVDRRFHEVIGQRELPTLRPAAINSKSVFSSENNKLLNIQNEETLKSIDDNNFRRRNDNNAAFQFLNKLNKNPMVSNNYRPMSNKQNYKSELIDIERTRRPRTELEKAVDRMFL
ncbi:heparan-sulfate 6-O-sulfotransferase 2-like [Biomphalaria glabrata]|uniref:Heparan-sulfate 6-O-sulfotransferase n=1 Tax=Biomphalaria glabrata TaxID=6526 RepID=A0A9W2YVY6_BIOGL|nr:heparan-sulfate 6-O-sulfotransferase 2-like [Biomphalaria glabrata]